MQKTLLLILGILCACATVRAQSGAIQGVITGADDGSSLPGASVYMSSNSTLGTVTDLDGVYRITGVPVGPDTLVVSYVGFATQRTPVMIVEGETVTTDAVLGGSVVMGQEIIVTAQLLGQAKAINQQLSSDAIANFVSADKIKELPDVNAAEAISRLPGVAINRSGGEGSKIVVRGLDPKFTAININGVRLPSTSGTDRSVDLSLISPELLSGIELFKSPTPDMDGDALGGTVNLNILKADDRPRASLKAIGGYNDLVNEFKDYKFTGSLSRRVFKDKLGIIATANVERFNRSGRIINKNWGNDEGVIIDDSLNVFDLEADALTLNHRREIRRRYNGSLGLDYAFGKNTDVTLLGIFSRTTRDQFSHSERYDADNGNLRFRPSINESGISLYSGSVSTRHRLNFMSIEWGVSHSQVTGETPYSTEFDFVSGAGGSFSPGFQDSRSNPLLLYPFVTANTSRTYLTGSSYSDTGNEELINTAFVDFKIPFSLGDSWRAEFKFGGKYRSNEKSRYFFEYYDKLYYLRPNSEWDALLPGGVEGASGLDPNSYLSISNFLEPGSDLFLEDQTGSDLELYFPFDEDILRRFDELFRDQYPQDFFGIVNNYDLKEEVTAGYAMFKFNLGEQLTVIPGFRYEQSNNVYNGIYADLNGDWGQAGQRTPRTSEVDYGVFLPHLHLKFKPKEWFDIRASYSTTLARPDFNYVVPATLVNRNGDLTISQGNPSLGASVSTNYDIYLTAFSGNFGLISVGGFYKDIKDAFYPLTLGVNDTTTAINNGLTPPRNFVGGRLTTYDSSPESQVYGFEFDLQSNLKFLPRPFSNMVFNLNYARLFSNTTVNSLREETNCVVIRGRPLCTTEGFFYQREAALIGQAEHILNASLGYDVGGFSARVSASYQGNKLSSYSSAALDDRYNQEFWRMDAALKYRFSRRLNVFLNLNNLTNQQDVNFFRDARYETSRATYGTTATVGVEVKFLPREE